MKKFARIIDLPKTQCLLVIDYDNEEEAFKTNITMDMGGAFMTLGFGFHKEKDAYHFMNNYTEKEALEIYETMAKELKA